MRINGKLHDLLVQARAYIKTGRKASAGGRDATDKYSQLLEAFHLWAVKTATELRGEIRAASVVVMPPLTSADIREKNLRGQAWHSTRGFFMDLPLAYYLTHSRYFLPDDEELESATRSLGKFLVKAGRDTAGTISSRATVETFRAKRGGMGWLGALGSASPPGRESDRRVLKAP